MQSSLERILHVREGQTEKVSRIVVDNQQVVSSNLTVGSKEKLSKDLRGLAMIEKRKATERRRRKLEELDRLRAEWRGRR